VQKLDTSDRRLIEVRHADRNTVLNDLLQVAVEKQQICISKQWSYTRPNGEVIMLRDSMTRVVEWVKKFRDVGDSVMQYDPAHAALPWAGMRVLLQVCSSKNIRVQTPAYNFQIRSQSMIVRSMAP
jgi:hypothetical protein